MISIIENYITKNGDFILSGIKILILFCVTYIVVYLIKYIINLLYKKAINTTYIADVAVLLALKKPIIFTIWFYCTVFSINILNNHLHFDANNKLFGIKVIVSALSIFWFLFNFVNQYTKRIIFKKEKHKESIDYGIIDFTRKIILILIGIVVAIITMNNLGVRMKGLAAVGGIASLAIGLASQDLLSNLFGGFSIFLDKPFTVGDWISSPDKDIEGTVEQIGWRQTKISRFTRIPIYLPNKIFSEIVIENKGRMKIRAIDEVIRIRFCDLPKVEKIVEDIKKMLISNKEVNTRAYLAVAMEKIDSSSLNIRIYTFSYAISYCDYLMTKQDVLLKSANIIRENGAELEYEATARYIDVAETSSNTSLIKEEI